MTPSIDLFVFGPSPASSPEAITDENNTVSVIGVDSASLATGAAETLNRLVSQSEADYLAYSEASLAPEPASLTAAAERMTSSPISLCQLCGDDDETQWIWSQFSAELAVLVRPLGLKTPCLFRKNSFDEVGPFHDVDEPIWEWIIRAAATDPNAVTFQTEESSDSRASMQAFPGLAPDQPPSERDWLRDQLLNFETQNTALQAGLLQLHDYLDASHRCSQSIEGEQLGDHWHAIMHRREPDYSNSKYWCRRVGHSALFQELAPFADQLLANCDDPRADSWRNALGTSDSWDAFAFVDLCSNCVGDGSGLEKAAERIQFHEMLLLLAASIDA